MELAGNERLADLTQVPLVVGVEEGITGRPEEGLGACACRSRSRRDRLRHKSRVKAGAIATSLMIRRQVRRVSAMSRRRVAQVDLVL